MFYSDKWDDTKEVIVGLYPKWTPTGEQAKIFRDRFAPLDQSALQEAVKRMWLEDKFGSGQLSPGKLRARYRIIKDEIAASFNGSQQQEDVYDEQAERQEIDQQNSACLRKLLLLPFDQVKAAAAKVLSGLGRWTMFSKISVGSDNPSDWSFMGRCAVLYEIENPTEDKEGMDAHRRDVAAKPPQQGVLEQPPKPSGIELLDSI